MPDLRVRAPFELRVMAGLAAGLLVPLCAHAAQPTLAPDMPAHFTPRTDSFDYVRREVMIPMRDGVRLHTVLIIPKGATRAPIILDRTPYNADESTARTQSAHMSALLPSAFDVISQSGYIVAVQDVRGKYGSEGQYVNERPLRGPDNPTSVDHATDCYDTIDWLVKNTPETNGRVGIMGTSYDGMMALMALADPHPALKVSVPINPVADTWMGDDDFHNGAFRPIGYDYYYSQDTVRGSGDDLWRRAYDDYDTFLRAGSSSDFTREYGLDTLGFPQKLAAHPAYDAYWQAQALDRILATRPHKVPVMFVQGQWDQEDIYGAAATWEATRKQDTAGEDRLVVGPWRHGQANSDGSSLGPIKFDGDTALYFRRYILQPFLDAHLKDAAPPAQLAPVTAYETGTNVWRGYASWPPAGEAATPIYLHKGGGLGFQAVAARPGSAPFDSYVSDPAKPVPYRLRPIRPTYSTGSTWSQWLVDDQRIFGRPARRAELRDRAAERAGAHGRLSPGGAVGGDQRHGQRLGGQADRRLSRRGGRRPQDGRLPARHLHGHLPRPLSLELRDKPQPITPNRPEFYRWTLPTADHVFLPGHRIMVQVQSSWFPLYDRNPQTYVANIFYAKPADYRSATQRIYDAGPHDSFISLPLLPITAAEASAPGMKPPMP